MPAHAPAEAFFLAAAPGERYCLYHAPLGTCRGALVYLHPFAEEMNKSRRMAALQARALAAAGYGVLQIDLHGCGDSDGDFGDARWEHWLADVAAARAWLEQRVGQPAGLWGLRLGALLALDYANSHPLPQLVLWQPVLQGANYLTQFLRLRLASDMLDESAPAGGTKELRAQLAAGDTLEIAGYHLAPQLAARIDTLDAASLQPACPTHWFELVAAAERPLPPAATRVAQAWGAQEVRKVAGAPFWSTQEIAEVPALIAATCAALTGAQHG
ncbi:MAG TPA: hydrolase 2, exosortase A system-associated [Telluria sp.]|jgi:exosortase A-associated hydrolase 2